MHSAIESWLKEEVTDLDGLFTVALGFVHAELLKEDVKRGDYNSEYIDSYVQSMCESFLETIAPEVERGGLIEYNFNVPTNINVGGYKLGFQGTMDYVSPSGVIWDWKTAARAYFVNEKQKQSIQASVYTYAGSQLGITTLPADFRYGVMIRQQKPKAQVVKMIRSQGQIDWLLHQASSAVSSAMSRGTESSWFKNDQQNLCSSKWCNYWSICKGAHVTDDDMTAPPQ